MQKKDKRRSYFTPLVNPEAGLLFISLVSMAGWTAGQLTIPLLLEKIFTDARTLRQKETPSVRDHLNKYLAWTIILALTVPVFTLIRVGLLLLLLLLL